MMTSLGLITISQRDAKGTFGRHRASISASVAGDTGPSEPRAGSLASMMSAPR